MRKLIALALILATLNGCAEISSFSSSVDTTIDANGKITQQILDEAWQEALKVGSGNPKWPIPVTLARVVYIPSSLVLGPHQFYGITVTEPMLIDGKLELVETIEIHLPHNLACHIKQVLIHELLHTVGTRRFLTDKTFMAEVEKAGGGEEWVRSVYPIEDMGPCGD